jgi:hypothetical protein
MNSAMRDTVWFEISGISKDELDHECFCGVGDLGIYKGELGWVSL